MFVWLSNFSAFSSELEVLFPEKLILQSPQAVKTENISEYCGVDDGLEQCSRQESEVSVNVCSEQHPNL